MLVNKATALSYLFEDGESSRAGYDGRQTAAGDECSPLGRRARAAAQKLRWPPPSAWWNIATTSPSRSEHGIAVTHFREQRAKWARERTEADPNYFKRLAEQQSPEFLWIGCSDSRVPSNVIVGFILARCRPSQRRQLWFTADLNCMSVLQYAVEASR